jgi:hypothetical protein
LAGLKEESKALDEKFTKFNMPVTVIPYLNKDMLNALGITAESSVTAILQASKKVVK